MRLLSTIRSAADHIAKQEAMIDALAMFGQWAIGEGPLPADEEAERVAWNYLRVIVDEWGIGVAEPYFNRLMPEKGVTGIPGAGQPYVFGPQLLTTRCPDEFEPPTMLWSECLRRLNDAAELRVALGRIKLATRRALDGDRIGTIRALRGAIDVFGESKLSDYVRLQWRVAELEVEARGLADRYDGPSKKSIENRGSDR